MAESTQELIVEFKRGVTEDAARGVVGASGGTVRRRMRTDHADQVMLLVRVPSGAAETAERGLARDASVSRVEPNQGGFRPMS